MANRKAVTKALLNRVLDTLEARGRTVAKVDVRDDGTVSLGLTTGERVPVPSTDQADTDWDKALGL